MVTPAFNFTTGPSTVPDIGKVEYNGCVFSPLFVTTVSGSAIKDNASRTIKYMEYTLTVDGYVTAPVVGQGAANQPITTSIDTLRNLLTKQGGALIYQGRGCDFIINVVGGPTDAVWGPLPELLEFQPLGGGLSAKIQWKCKIRIPEDRKFIQTANNPNAPKWVGGIAALPLLQFNYETNVTYNDDGYSTLSVNGTLEIPLTRTPTQKTRTVSNTADDMRGIIDARIMDGIDLNLFRVTQRNFKLSRDKRTLEWDFQIEEKPYMDMPLACNIARGSYSVRPAKAGMGLCTWLCTLRVTYNVRKDMARRNAWLSFLALLRWRMIQCSSAANIPAPNGNQNAARDAARILAAALPAGPLAPLVAHDLILKAQNDLINKARKEKQSAFLVDFNFDEGLYADSKTITFSASWRLVTTFSHILLASGLWRKLQEKNAAGQNVWAIAMRDIQGAQSWLQNRANPNVDVIVDFGG